MPVLSPARRAKGHRFPPARRPIEIGAIGPLGLPRPAVGAEPVRVDAAGSAKIERQEDGILLTRRSVQCVRPVRVHPFQVRVHRVSDPDACQDRSPVLGQDFGGAG